MTYFRHDKKKRGEAHAIPQSSVNYSGYPLNAKVVILFELYSYILKKVTSLIYIFT